MLKNDGDFLLRKVRFVFTSWRRSRVVKTEAEGKPRIALSVFNKQHVRHILLNFADNLWCIRQARCSGISNIFYAGSVQVKKESLVGLIEHHIKEKVPVQADGTTLVNPIPRPDFYILHDVRSEIQLGPL